MKEDDEGRTRGWFRVEHAAIDAITDGCGPRARHWVLAGYVALVKVANTRRALTFEAGRRDIAEIAGMSVDTLDSVVVPALADLGLATRKPGERGRPNVWYVRTTVGGRSEPVGSRHERVGVPPTAAGGAAGSGSTRGRPLRGEEEGKRGKKGAPDGADSPSTSDDPAMGRADAIVSLHSDLVAKQTGARPHVTAKDRAAALDLAERLDPEGWEDRLDVALRVGLSGNDFRRSRVTSLSGLSSLLVELLAEADRSETGPPPAGWDDDDGAAAAPGWESIVDNLVAESVARGDEVEPPDEMPDWALRRYAERIEAHRCGGCEALGDWKDDLDGCCSRRCQLQADHARSLAATAPDDLGPEDMASTFAAINAESVDIEF